jgi:hypothetical protein
MTARFEWVIVSKIFLRIFERFEFIVPRGAGRPAVDEVNLGFLFNARRN